MTVLLLSVQLFIRIQDVVYFLKCFVIFEQETVSIYSKYFISYIKQTIN